MPPKARPRNAPNQHDKRHESGLAAPGKRVTKQRSNGQLNGQPNGKPSPSASPVPPLPSTGLNQGFRFTRSPDPSTVVAPNYDSAPPARDHAATPEYTSRGRMPSDMSVDEVGPRGEIADGNNDHAQDSFFPVVNDDFYPVPSRPGLPQSHTSTASAVSTILTNYPLRDAISILILLLSLPPTLVLVIQTLFASLTFVPPTAGLSLSNLPNIKELFSSGGLGYPALATILFADAVFFFSWSLVWSPLQEVLLDLSQAVIAVSLSGAASTNARPTYSILTTSFIVFTVHVLRYKAIHLTALDYLRSVINRTGVGLPVDFSHFATSYFLSSPAERGWLHNTIRTMLGIHIISQGVTTCIRRSLVKANEQNANVPTITRSEAEPGGGAEQRSTSASLEAGQRPAPIINPDSRLPGPSPARRDSRPRDLSSKKKRKQANQVRSQQPLWAAIASTKVTFIKEMEQRDAADDAREAGNMHTTTNIPSITTGSTADRLWICEVRDTEIFFTVELSSQSTVERVDDGDDTSSVGPGIDKNKPFYVSINGAAWSSTKIVRISEGTEADSRKIERYEGEIFGLAPLSSYLCEIVSISSKKALCEASVITQPAVSAEQAVLSPQPPPQTLRPSSPISTLKQSIQSAEAKLNETRNRGRKSKKDQRAIHSDIKREIQNLRSKLDHSGGFDDKAEKRLMQITQHKKQAEEAAAEIRGQIEALGEIPGSEIAESEAQRRKWQAALDAKNATQRELEHAKSEAERELGALRSDIFQAESRYEKLVARHAQRTQDIEKMVSKQHADMSAKQKRDFERAQIQQIREAEEQQLRFHTANFDAEAEGYQQKAHDCYAQIAQLQSWPHTSSSSQQQQPYQLQQPPPYPGYSSPSTPDNQSGSAVGTPAQVNGHPAFVPQQQQQPQPFANVSPFAAAAAIVPLPPQQSAPPRQRSSSMLSEYSGFTDDGVVVNNTANLTAPLHPSSTSQAATASTPYPSWVMPPSTSTPTHPHPVLASAPDERRNSSYHANNSEGSASLSGSTGSNSPRPDAKVFVPGSVASGVAGAIPGLIGTKSGSVGPGAGAKDKVAQSSPLQTEASAVNVDKAVRSERGK